MHRGKEEGLLEDVVGAHVAKVVAAAETVAEAIAAAVEFAGASSLKENLLSKKTCQFKNFS